MQRQPLKKMDQKSGKAVLVHKNDSTVLRPKSPEAGTFFHYSFFFLFFAFPNKSCDMPTTGQQ